MGMADHHVKQQNRLLLSIALIAALAWEGRISGFGILPSTVVETLGNGSLRQSLLAWSH